MRRVIVVQRTRHTPVYNIGITSRLAGLPIYTLRWVEKAGLVHPERTAGKQRLFSDADIEILCRIRELLAQRVNLSGIRIILQMSLGTSPDGLRKVRRRRGE